MALHKTQCPHCFTSYVISDAQLRVSEGMVRCGTCRERFQARIIDEIEAPRFDPREAFIEPLSDEAETSADETVTRIEQQLAPQTIEFVDPKTESVEPEQVSLNVDPNTNKHSTSLIEELESPSASYDPTVDIEELSTSEVLANIKAKQKRELRLARQQELALKLPVKAEPKTGLDTKLTDQRIAPEAGRKQVNDGTNLKASTVTRDLPQEANNQRVHQERTVEKRFSAASEASIEQTPFDLTEKVKKKGKPWLYVPVLSVLILALGILLGYQLWMKQVIDFEEGSVAHTKLVKLTVPLTKQLEDHGISLPVRRNLGQMKLLSAHTEPHPTQTSTTLLRVNIVNRAAISQPLPWLEMSLTDADGRLVSRRNLSPNDYIYNNDSLSHIGAKELKKITIELLSFPKHAAGYELKLLDR